MALFRTPWTALITSTILACTAAQAGPTLDRIKSTQTITLGYRPNSAPMSYEDKGQVIGYAIEICQRLATAVQQQLKLPNLKVRYAPVSAAERVPAVLDGRIDMECAGTTNTKARRDQVAFGLTYFYAGASVLVRASDGIRGLVDLRGKTLAAVKGTTGLQVAEMRERAVGWKLALYDNTRAAVEALEQGKVDAVIQDNIQLLPLAAQARQKLVLTGQPLSIEPLAPLFAKNDPELHDLLLTAMRQLYRDGQMDALYDRWFSSPLPGRGFSLGLKINPLLHDNFRRPSAYVTDWVVL